MNDDEFFTRLSDCTLPPALFQHHGHVRLGWICLQRYPSSAAIELACDAIARYAAHLGAADKFHRTVTEALMRIMLACGAADRTQDWHAFALRSAPVLADAQAQLARYYSPSLLASDAARRNFVEPDLLALPC